jgi:hypothetical protein
LILLAIAGFGIFSILPYNNKHGNDNIADFPAPLFPLNKISFPESS